MKHKSHKRVHRKPTPTFLAHNADGRLTLLQLLQLECDRKDLRTSTSKHISKLLPEQPAIRKASLYWHDGFV